MWLDETPVNFDNYLLGVMLVKRWQPCSRFACMPISKLLMANRNNLGDILECFDFSGEIDHTE